MNVAAHLEASLHWVWQVGRPRAAVNNGPASSIQRSTQRRVCLVIAVNVGVAPIHLETISCLRPNLWLMERHRTLKIAVSGASLVDGQLPSGNQRPSLHMFEHLGLDALPSPGILRRFLFQCHHKFQISNPCKLMHFKPYNWHCMISLQSVSVHMPQTCIPFM